MRRVMRRRRWEVSDHMASSPPARAPLLIVDDDKDTRVIVRVAAEYSGYCVAEAATIAEARSFLQATTCSHIVLLDFLFPAENADALLREVSEDATLQWHAFILMPANPPTQFSDEAQRLIARWCDGVITKPFDLSTMLACITRAEAHLSQQE